MVVSQNKTLSASLEDYLEVIFNLAGQSQTVRSTDIAKALGVSKPSVTGALRVLKSKGLANYRPYDCVTLTPTGQAAAAEVVRKHNILKSFLVSLLGIDKDVAHRAACRAEHALGPEVIGRLLRFIEFVTKENKDGYDLARRFRRFCRRKAAEDNHRTAKKWGKNK